jgi:acyl carrier protein
MENMSLDKMKDFFLDYGKKEYLDDEEVELNYDTPLISSRYVISLSMVSLLIFFENKLKIKIPPSKAIPKAFDSINKNIVLVNI